MDEAGFEAFTDDQKHIVTDMITSYVFDFKKE
jgi:hypothetical protein